MMETTTSTETPAPGEGQNEGQQLARTLHAATPKVVVTPVILIANVAVFVAMALDGAGVLTSNPEVHLRWGANFAPLTTDGQWWRLFTATFLHFGVLHLVFNMWALAQTGWLVERLFGNVFFAGVYVFAGVTGSLASTIWRHDVVSAGASGAIFGVYGALFAYLLFQRGSVPASVVSSLIVSSIGFVAYSLFNGFARAGIDNAAHLGGLAGGFVMGAVLARPLAPEPRAEATMRRIALGLLVGAFLVPGVIRFVPDASRSYKQEQRFKAEVKTFVEGERRLRQTTNQLIQQVRAGSVSDMEFAARLNTDVVPGWEHMYARLHDVSLEPSSALRERQDVLVKYVGLRRDAVKALAEGVRDHNSARIQESNALHASADALIKELNAKSAKTR